MSDLPPGWEWAQLSELVDVLDNMRVPISAKERASRVGSVPYYGATGQVGYIDKHIFDEDLVLLGEDGVQFFDPAKPKAYLVSGPSWVNNHAHVLRPRSDVLGPFLCHYLNQFDYRGYANGTTRLKLTQAAMNSIPVCVPPLAEQRRIVAVLEERFSCVSAASKILGSVEARARKLMKRVLVEAVPATSRPGWRKLTVGEAGKVDLGRQRHPDWHTGPHMRPYLRVANVFEDRLDLRDVMQMDFPPEVFDRFRLTPGDILLNEGQSPEYLGRPAMYRGEPAEIAFTNSLLRFRAHEGIDPEWALLVFRRHMHAGRFIKEVRITTNIAHLSASRFKEVEFPVPPVEEQRAIVAQTKERLDGLARLADSVQLAKVRAGRLREALLAEAFAGRLVEQDPADEPASELLARIRAQRVVVPKQRGRRTAKELAAPATRAIGTDFQQGELPL